MFSVGSIQYVLSQIDVCIQFGEDADVKIKDEDEDFGDDQWFVTLIHGRFS